MARSASQDGASLSRLPEACDLADLAACDLEELCDFSPLSAWLDSNDPYYLGDFVDSVMSAAETSAGLDDLSDFSSLFSDWIDGYILV